MACVQGLFACSLSISFIWSLPSWSTKGKWKKTQNVAVGFECFAVFLPEAISLLSAARGFPFPFIFPNQITRAEEMLTS